MAVGLRIFNDDGITQISDTAHNMVLVGKGTVTGGGGNTYATNFTFTHEGPVFMAVRAPNGATVIHTNHQGSTYHYTILWGNNQDTATWYAFSYPKNIQSTMGLRVFNAAGSLVYDAAQKPLRIAHYASIWTPGIPSMPSNPKNIPEYPAWPPDIYVPQQRSNRTYASLGISMPPYRVARKLRSGKSWILGYNLHYYVPVPHSDGIKLQAVLVLFSGENWPTGTIPYSGSGSNPLILYPSATNYQNSWIIDVTDY